MPTGDLNRLASYVIARRLKLGYKDRGDLASASGITARTLGKVETGRHVGTVTLAELEMALGWEPDSARSILRGGEPVVSQGDGAAELPEMSDDERRDVLSYLKVRRAAERGA